jgi:hypothetical protein
LVTVATAVGTAEGEVVGSGIGDKGLDDEGGRTTLGLLRQTYAVSIAADEAVTVDVYCTIGPGWRGLSVLTARKLQPLQSMCEVVVAVAV